MKFIFALLAFLIPGCATGNTIKPETTAEFAKTSVMITNAEQTHGGSGVVYRSWPEASFILTNRHVCEILKTGGTVEKGDKLYPVVAFKESKKHDICLVQVKADLEVSTVLASEEPELYSKAFISGHPSLYPHVLTRGDFTGKMEIDVEMDTRDCTEKEMEADPVRCLLEGYAVVERFNTQLVSATIMPGSSGSAVFNESGEIAGLVFAGNKGELSYAFIVPYKYVAYFIKKEAKTLKWTYPTVLPAFQKAPEGKGKGRSAVVIEPQVVIRSPRIYKIETWKKLIELINGSNQECSKKP